MKWIGVHEMQPILEDKLVLGHFENGSIETIHIEDWFRDIGNGFDADGNQLYTKWYLSSKDVKLTHWMQLPEPPNF